MSAGTPEAEVVIDEELVEGLLRDQHPDLAERPIRPIDAGWDNATFRLGTDLGVRLPRRSVSAELVAHEQTWLPRIAARLPIPTPTPERVGRPGRGFPWRWSVVPWIDGTTADREPPDPDQAERLSAFLAALHVPAPMDAPVNTVRGVPLEARQAVVEERMRRLDDRTDAVTPGIRSVWQSALSAPIATEAMWLHGDLHPRNVLVDGGRLCGIIDWGDITSGDVATDLASIWMLFGDRSARSRAIASYLPRRSPSADPDEAVVTRARGWAVVFGVVLLDSGLTDDPRHAAIGASTLARVEEDFRAQA